MTRNEFFKKYPDATQQDYKEYLTKVISLFEDTDKFIDPYENIDNLPVSKKVYQHD